MSQRAMDSLDGLASGTSSSWSVRARPSSISTSPKLPSRESSSPFLSKSLKLTDLPRECCRLCLGRSMESNDESDDPSDFFVESVSCGLRSTCRWMMEAGEWDELAELGGDDCPRSGVAPRILLRSMIAFWL